MVSANTCPARLTRGSNVLNDLPKLQEPTHNLPIHAFTRSVSCEWAYLQRVVNGCDVEFQRLRDTILHVFTPAVVGREILEKEHDLLELPARFGGLALADPVKTASQAFAVSQEATRLLKDAVFTGADIDMADHMAHCERTVTAAAKERDDLFTRRSSQLIASLPPLAQQTLSRIVKGNASGWLTVLPLRQEGYDLTLTKFRDHLAIRYGHEPSHLLSHCDGCGASFTHDIQHALDCSKGGLIKRGHKKMTIEIMMQS